MLLFRVWTCINIEITCKNSGPNLKNWARFWDLKFFNELRLRPTWLTKINVTRSISKIQGSSFVFILILISFENYASQHRVSLFYFCSLYLKKLLLLKYTSVCIPPPWGSRVEKFEFKFCQTFLFLIFRKSHEISIHYVHPFKSKDTVG